MTPARNPSAIERPTQPDKILSHDIFNLKVQMLKLFQASIQSAGRCGLPESYKPERMSR